MSSSSKYITDAYKYVKRNSSAPKLARTQDNDNGNHPVPSSSKDILQPNNTRLTDRELLRQFDMNLDYGPCLGITRMERWERADKHKLLPPVDVRDLIEQHKGDPIYTESVWNEYVI